MIALEFLINPKLHAHAKGHWRAKAAATKAERATAALIAMASRQTPIHGPVQVAYRFTVPDRRRRDAANLVQACKPIIDGICDAGLIDGDHWEVMAISGVSVSVGKTLSVVIQIEVQA